MNSTEPTALIQLGWREWVTLPELGISQIKCKVDTGARTSALHAFHLQPFNLDGVAMLRFSIHPLQNNTELVQTCEAVVTDRRTVTDSGGHRESRYCITTEVQIGASVLPIEMTLTDRDTMKFRMLLGRTALRGLFLVDPSRSFLLGRPANQPNQRPAA